MTNKELNEKGVAFIKANTPLLKGFALGKILKGCESDDWMEYNMVHNREAIKGDDMADCVSINCWEDEFEGEGNFSWCASAYPQEFATATGEIQIDTSVDFPLIENYHKP